jgi:hypothetical protein
MHSILIGLLFIKYPLQELSFRHDRVDRRAVVVMGIGIVTYRARIGGFAFERKVESGIRVKGQESSLVKIWFLGLVILLLLVIGGVEANPGPQMEREN